VMPVLTPQMRGRVIIKANLGQGESMREEETTADEDREREVSELRELSKASAMPHDQVMKVKGRTPRMRCACVPKQAKIIVLAEVRTVPCDQCQTKALKCYTRTMGGQPLKVCVRCHRQKLSCQTGGMGGQKRVGKVPDEKGSESSASNEESEESGREWLAKFSTMKVGPPKGIRHTMG